MDRPAAAARLPLVACLLLAGGGCAGYQVGNGTLYRPDIRTVYVPVFQSDSLRPTLGERLTEAVVKEIELKTPYKVVHHPAADSVLTGRIVSEQKHVVAEDANDQPRDLDVGLVVQVNWYDRHGSAILENASFAYAPFAFAVTQNANLIPESGQSVASAHQQAVARLAEQIVAQMELPW